MTNSAAPTGRIASLDQFRGYTVAGMFLVNFLGAFAACPKILKHSNDYCSYADTIMPQFLFAVGFAFRLTFERRIRREGARAAYFRVIRRLLGLSLLAFAIYVVIPEARDWPELRNRWPREALTSIFKRDWFQTLLHIAVTSLWILPVIRASTSIRIAFAAASGLLHVALSAWFNFVWANTPPNAIDGGPLGFLTWTIPAIVGTLACDIVTSTPRPPLRSMLCWALGLMLAGWLLSCGTRLYDVRAAADVASEEEFTRTEKNRLAASPVIPPPEAWEGRNWTSLLAEPPFQPPPRPSLRKWNYWMMSQRAGTLSYLTFAAGFSMGVFALFYFACDIRGWRSEMFQTFGVNALAGYVLHDPIAEFAKNIVPKQAAPLTVWIAFAIYFAVIWLVLRAMKRRNLIFRL